MNWLKFLWHKYGIWAAYERIENGRRYGGDFKEDTVIYRTFYLQATHFIILWIVGKTRSGNVTGDCGLRICRNGS